MNTFGVDISYRNANVCTKRFCSRRFFPIYRFASFSAILFLPSKGTEPMYAWRRGFDSLGVSLVQVTDKTVSTFFSISHRL